MQLKQSWSISTKRRIPLHLKSLNIGKTTTNVGENPSTGLEQTHTCGRVNPLNRTQPYPVNNCNSNGYKDIKKIKTLTDSLPTKKTTLLSQKWMTKYGQYKS